MDALVGSTVTLATRSLTGTWMPLLGIHEQHTSGPTASTPSATRVHRPKGFLIEYAVFGDEVVAASPAHGGLSPPLSTARQTSSGVFHTVADTTKPKPVPTVGGQSARLIYDLIESLQIVDGDDSSLDFERQFPRPHAVIFGTAYDRIEHEFLLEYENCPCGDLHEPLSPGAWKYLVIHAMADRAREALGLHDRHPRW